MLKIKTLLVVLLTLAGMASAAINFVHPGARSSLYDLDFVKGKIANGEQPWTSHLNQARNAGGDSRALGKALNWYYTGDVQSAEDAISALNSWNGHAPYEPAPNNGGNQSSLEGAWVASVLAPAAEIMSLYAGWSQTDKDATKAMFRTVFLPAMMQMSYWNGNVDLTQIDALLSIAVFLEDEAAFNEGIQRLSDRLPAYFYLSSDPASVRRYANGSYNWGGVNTPLSWVDGVSQELCRDNGHHAQFAIAAALAALETAYIQGVDLYTPHQERMVAAMELMAIQLDTKDMQGVCSGTATDEHGDGDRYNTLEIGYNHYHNRKGIAMPQTWAEITKELRDGRQQFNMFHETLTHGDIVYDNSSTLFQKSKTLNTNASITLHDKDLIIHSNNSEVLGYEIYSMSGVNLEAKNQKMEPGVSQSIHVGNSFVPGVYLVKINSSKRHSVHKFLL